MAHRTIFVDIDEEITSIISKTRKVREKDIIIVVPKNAMLLQSIVNLRLVKKEADRKKKNLIIITQDKVGKKLIEKAGITVRSKIEDEHYENMLEDERDHSIDDSREGRVPEHMPHQIIDDKLIHIGSSDYFDEMPMIQKNIEKKEPNSSKRQGDLIKKSRNGQIDIKKSEGTAVEANEKNLPGSVSKMADIFRNSKSPINPKPNKVIQDRTSNNTKSMRTNEFYVSAKEGSVGEGLEKFMKKAPGTSLSNRKKDALMEKTKVGGVKIFFKIFFVFLILMIAGGGAYFILPKAQVDVQIRQERKEESLNIRAFSNEIPVDSGYAAIPARLKEENIEITETFKSSGSKDGKGRASGKVTIYNEYSAEEQPLVTTTRLETEDGKIFRINTGVVVPGMKQSGSEKKAGSVEVQVLADQSGSSYNIGPSKFQIPGFKGGPKYEKFFAESTTEMVGGDGEASPVITQQDISQAKSTALDILKREYVTKFEEEQKGMEEKCFPDAVQIKVSESKPSQSPGEQAKTFDLAVSGTAKNLCWKKSDVEQIIKDMFEKKGMETDQMRFDRPITYLLSSYDLEKGELDFEVKADVLVGEIPDKENFKKGVLGKTISELQVFAKNYPSINRIEARFWPFFVNKIPLDPKRVEIKFIE